MTDLHSSTSKIRNYGIYFSLNNIVPDHWASQLNFRETKCVDNVFLLPVANTLVENSKGNNSRKICISDNRLKLPPNLTSNNSNHSLVTRQDKENLVSRHLMSTPYISKSLE